MQNSSSHLTASIYKIEMFLFFIQLDSVMKYFSQVVSTLASLIVQWSFGKSEFANHL